MNDSKTVGVRIQCPFLLNPIKRTLPYASLLVKTNNFESRLHEKRLVDRDIVSSSSSTSLMVFKSCILLSTFINMNFLSSNIAIKVQSGDTEMDK